MWTHSDVAVLLKAGQTAYLLQQEEFAEPQPGIAAMLDRWEKRRPSRTSSMSQGPNGWDHSGSVCASSSRSSGRRRGWSDDRGGRQWRIGSRSKRFEPFSL
jgi:hypothetical protein